MSQKVDSTNKKIPQKKTLTKGQKILYKKKHTFQI